MNSWKLSYWAQLFSRTAFHTLIKRVEQEVMWSSFSLRLSLNNSYWRDARVHKQLCFPVTMLRLLLRVTLLYEIPYGWKAYATGLRVYWHVGFSLNRLQLVITYSNVASSDYRQPWQNTWFESLASVDHSNVQLQFKSKTPCVFRHLIPLVLIVCKLSHRAQFTGCRCRS